jgi:hypothetical protein
MRRFTLFDFLGLFALLLAQVGDHHAQGLTLESAKPVERNIDGNQASITATQTKLALCSRLPSIPKQSFESVSLRFRNQRLERNANSSPCRPAGQFRNPAIAIEYGAIA